jgi:hypothetical protein
MAMRSRRSRRRQRTLQTRRRRTHRGGAILDVPRPVSNIPLAVAFGSASASQAAPLLTKAQTRAQPTVSWDSSEPLTLICWDPDASWLHWLVTGARGSPASGTTVVPWAPPTPPSGTHRYIFGLFRHGSDTGHPGAEARRDFNIVTWAGVNTPLVGWTAVRVAAL